MQRYNKSETNETQGKIFRPKRRMKVRGKKLACSGIKVIFAINFKNKLKNTLCLKTFKASTSLKPITN